IYIVAYYICFFLSQRGCDKLVSAYINGNESRAKQRCPKGLPRMEEESCSIAFVTYLTNYVTKHTGYDFDLQFSNRKGPV
ncbi:hypothetical protein Anas_13908, partial [Armadillidium nasatum]